MPLDPTPILNGLFTGRLQHAFSSGINSQCPASSFVLTSPASTSPGMAWSALDHLAAAPAFAAIKPVRAVKPARHLR